MPRITKINHIGIAVSDLDLSLTFWRDVLGLKMDHVEEVPGQKSFVAFLPTGESEIELIKPTSEESTIAKFLAEKGAGIHHICFEVDDITGMLAELKARGVRLINETPLEAPGRLMAFIHPKSALGVLVELYQTLPA